MEVPILLVMGIFAAIIVIAGIIYSVSEFQKMRKNRNNGRDKENNEDE
ncbi:MAG: hypothetical protein WD267_01120 [Balneolales bacterium]